MYKITIIVSKLIYLIIKTLKLGSGYAWSGYIALKLYPNILNNISKVLPKHIILISGTNGKTTLAKITAHILEKKGFKVLYNKTGGNLINGIVSTVLLESNLKGSIEKDFVIFEIDELALPILIKHIKPEIIALLNLSRDQLDRYWEVDLLVQRWKESFSTLDKETKVLLYKNQDEFRDLIDSAKNVALFFDDDPSNLNRTSLMGTHNAVNLNCALSILGEFGIKADEATNLLSDFDYAYGRGEEIVYKEKEFLLLLAKNPASFNNNINLLLENKFDFDTVLFILNDNIPDGKDVSWIYDIDPIPLKKVTDNKKVYITGTRALDMSVRLSYAGIKNMMFSDDKKKIVSSITANVGCRKIVVLPNYSSMLQLRKIIKGRSIL
ncbi:hypothetical protein A2V49_04435 [candidate division WWE3 bacterium RBG_19FT_COMBO_34_6]|uniref:Lipid II isoglutaminyl synthase (glutamine-hydrolyzing) subunit MurT n=1 Tax=candidate division WWE3 bacterium RBG_19FT_COMBO_34_6 TaxID=1802612 RepID=A0A1F4UMM9_UNCKA|nr:MAG: hypothetical protein A2V49_04435 [candidate division WWE3 bacterium RBG_19FT_COMBO_34_6]